MKWKCVLLVALVVCSGALTSKAQTGETEPVGITELTIAGASSTGGAQNTSIAVTLRHPVAYDGMAVSIGGFSSSSQVINTGVTNWATGQWTDKPHLCYVENAAGAEEAYLITAVNYSTGELTISTDFDILTRYPSTPKYTIVKANTLGNLFGTTGAEVLFGQGSSSSGADNIYFWTGSTWYTCWHNGTSWQSFATIFGGNENDKVVMPDDALFILRRGATDLKLVVTGSPPVKPQVSTLPGQVSRFTTVRYPEPVRVSQLGLEQLPNWVSATSSSNADKFYIWSGSSWITFWYTGSYWTRSAFTNDDNYLIPGSTGIFVFRDSTSSAADSAHVHQMPYPGQ